MATGALGYISYQHMNGNQASPYFMPFVSESLTANRNYLLSNNMRGRRFEENMYQGQTFVEGEIVMEPTPIQLRRFLKFFCNQNNDSTLVDNHWEWDFNPVNSTVSSGNPGNTVLFEANILDIMVTKSREDTISYHSEHFQGCGIKTMTLNMTAGALPTLSIGVVGWSHDFTDSNFTPVFDLEDEFTWEQSSFSIGSGTPGGYTSLTLTMDNMLEIRKPIGSDAWTDIRSAYADNKVFYNYTGLQTVEVTGTVQAFTEERTPWKDGDEVEATIFMQGPEIDSGYNADFTAIMPKVQITEWSNPIGGPGVLESSFTGKALYNAGSGTQINFTMSTSDFY